MWDGDEVDLAALEVEQVFVDGCQEWLLDSAGRLHVDDEMMAEAAAVHAAAKPVETLLVADAMTGQDAVNVAQSFHARLNLTGIVLTKLDGTAKGGIVLAIEQQLQLPVKLVGVGEGKDDLIAFDPVDYVDALLS